MLQHFFQLINEYMIYCCDFMCVCVCSTFIRMPCVRGSNFLKAMQMKTNIEERKTEDKVCFFFFC